MSSSIYYVQGTTVATAATDQHAICAIWNVGTGSRVIEIREFSIFAVAAPGAGSGFITRRISARGTAGSTYTPGANNHHRGQAAPQSAFVLDLATYSVQPTLVATSDLIPQGVLGAVIGSGFVIPLPYGIEVPAGAGVAIVNRAAIVVPACEVGFVVAEI